MGVPWYPGHMAKARALVRENVQLVDLILEVVDARIPLSSSNPELEKIRGRKPSLLVLNKADLADPAATTSWQEWFRSQGREAVPADGLTGQGVGDVIKASRRLVQPLMEKLRARGRRRRAVRLMIVGIPNVGKSSLLNRLAGRKRAATGAKPGITRGKQWVKVEGEMELLDLPGILWPRVEDEAIGLKLAATGALPLEYIPVEEVAFWLGAFLLKTAPEGLRSRYDLPPAVEEPEELMEHIAKRRGLLLPGGVADWERTARLLLMEFQRGLLGRITLELPPEEGDQ
ncbi:MAG: ribosome biogenesis GTPase YlqF [bacterium]|jgi:ribosome biogenesis GTPase A|nr:ribosome biogenesis GTPase YlqF [Bacillota bacterium]HHW54234.1 ribosome biogenesis GTPase YlqF [Bacillota bacterium]